MANSMSGATGYRPAGSATGLRGTGYKPVTLQNFTPEQQQLFQQLLGHVGPESFTSRLASGDQSQFEQLEAPALKQFGGLQGGLASRFSGMGMGARRSSGFANTQNQAASDFAQQLQSQRMGIQQQAIRDLMGMGESLLGQRPFETRLLEEKEPFWKQLLLGGLGFGSQLGGSYLGRKWGA